MSEPTHKVYLDESGNRDYSPDGRYSSNGGRTPYFVFGGLIVRPAVAGKIEKGLRWLKTEAFGSPNVEIKAHWLRRNDKRQEKYIQKFRIGEERLAQFCDEVYNLIVSSACELVACAVNKAEVQKEYSPPWYPPAIAYECLIQRVQLAMQEYGGAAHITIDDHSGKSPKGRDWKLNLMRQHHKLLTYGGQLRRNMSFDRIKGSRPKFRDSAHDERLQLADLVAYAVYRQFVDHGPDWEDPSKPLRVYEYLNRLAPRFRNRNGIVQGYGIVKFPIKTRVPWKP